MPRMAHSEKLISKRIPVQASSSGIAEGRTALKNTEIRLAPADCKASMVWVGTASKLWAKARVKKAVVCTQSPAIPAAGPIPIQIIIKRTHTGVGTARRKEKTALTEVERRGHRKMFSAASMPKKMERSRL